MLRHKFLQNFNTREQHILLSGKGFSSESGNEEAVANVYISKLFYYYFKVSSMVCNCLYFSDL
jgi:hypothetical protein